MYVTFYPKLVAFLHQPYTAGTGHGMPTMNPHFSEREVGILFGQLQSYVTTISGISDSSEEVCIERGM